MNVMDGATARTKENRRAPRMPVEWEVQARVLGAESPLGFARTDNVSKHGLALRVDHAVDRESVIKVSFDPSDGGGEVHAYATVAWSDLGPDEPRMGLRFMGIGEADEERIATLVEQWMLNGRGQSH